ncbi:LytR/AlgR family response regulator transcription factor [Luteirhabdus pelagi]|uniref:LytR/AlgR family response regulator transcription factor n=1 Tax=Luteirhabdus pelagi TaxID=2792783 RepID=UPI00193AA054|nr:LytTR family DNA-binding domain-containing protein [Luteirhabdus pelagi]
MKINTILVDDEPKALASLEHKIKRFCKEIKVVKTFQNPQNAISYLKNNEVDLVFLDVAMPEMNGFEMLQQLDRIAFEIIFATGFDEYAIEAIQHCAIGYLVKPIDNDELIDTVGKALDNIEEKNAKYRNQQLLDNFRITRFQDRKVIIPTQEGLEFLELNHIIRCEGVDGYTKIFIKDRKPILSSQNIGHFVKLFEGKDFFQVHKSHMVNLNYISKYLKEGYVIVGTQQIPVSRYRRNEFLDQIKG